MTLKTMAELNANKPHLRDLEITVDGLNVVDIQFAGPGVWVPRFTVQISGDMGLDPTNGTRQVYQAAAEYLRNVLLGNLHGCDVKQHNFVPHANISRDDLDGDCAAAVTAANAAISGLLALYNGVKIDESDELANEGHYECYTKALHIVVRTVDFDLVEKRILSADAFAKVQAAIDVPANPSPELVKLMGGKCINVNTTVLDTKPELSYNEGLDVRNETKLFDGIQHKLLVIPVTEGAVDTMRLWVPLDCDLDITTFCEVDNRALLTCVSPLGEEAAEWRLLEKEALLSVLNETKFFDGVRHERKEMHDDALGRLTAVWVPEGVTLPEGNLDDLVNNGLVTMVFATPVEHPQTWEWRLL